MNKEKQYLQAIENKFKEQASMVLQLNEEGIELLNKLLVVIKDAIAYEKSCRAQYEIGSRFSVIINQLNELAQDCQNEINTLSGNAAMNADINSNKGIAEDEVAIFMYLFNSQGANIKSWRPQLEFKALMDHSINRP